MKIWDLDCLTKIKSFLSFALVRMLTEVILFCYLNSSKLLCPLVGFHDPHWEWFATLCIVAFLPRINLSKFKSMAFLLITFLPNAIYHFDWIPRSVSILPIVFMYSNTSKIRKLFAIVIHLLKWHFCPDPILISAYHSIIVCFLLSLSQLGKRQTLILLFIMLFHESFKLKSDYSLVIESHEGSYISVVDDPKRDIRILRCDNSVIGGIYRRTGDPIFGSFYMQQIGTLSGPGDSALLIGLGTGFTYSLMSNMGIECDIIEIEEAVVNFCQYFNVSLKGNVWIEDALKVIPRLEKQYDFIIHDIFSAGTLLGDLYSENFFRNLKGLLNNSGNLLVVILL